MPMSSLEGPLSKWTNVIHGWQFRWFVLDQLNGLLSYYTSKENMTKGERRGCIRLKDAYVGYDNEDDITFTITVDDKTFHLQARNLDEREKWVGKIERTIRVHSTSNQTNSSIKSKSILSDIVEKNIKSLNETHKDSLNFNSVESSSDIDSKAATNSNENSNYYPSSSNTSRLNKTDFLQFDSSLSESDAYLQLLIEQLKSLENRRTCLLGEKQSISTNNNNSIKSTNGNSANDLQKIDNNSSENSKIKQNSNTELAVNNILDNKSITSHGSDDVDKDIKVYDSVINATEVKLFFFVLFCVEILFLFFC